MDWSQGHVLNMCYIIYICILYWGILWIWQTRKRQAECESIATHFVNWCSPCQAYVRSILIFSLISHQGPYRDSHSYFISHFDLILWMPQESAGAPSIFTDFPASSNIHITHMTQLRKCFALGSSTALVRSPAHRPVLSMSFVVGPGTKMATCHDGKDWSMDGVVGAEYDSEILRDWFFWHCF